MVTTINPASLMVSWQPPPVIDHNGPLTGHVIQYSRLGSSDMMNDDVTSGTTHTISGVVAYSNYSVKVTAVNDQGTGPFSNPVVQVSGEDGRLLYEYQLATLTSISAVQPTSKFYIYIYVLLVSHKRTKCEI